MLVRAPAKINFILDVLERRADGYHDIASIVQTIDLFDILEIELGDSSAGVTLTVHNTDHAIAPAGPDNIAARAASALLERVGAGTGLRIALTKHIPAEAGLGGGSSDAAATLGAANRLLGSPLGADELTDLAASLGADVPYFLTGGLCAVAGIGERVTPLQEMPSRPLAIVKPPLGVSTSAAYAALGRPYAAVRQPDPSPARWDGKTLRNDFQPVVASAHRAVEAALDALCAAGCTQTLVCGSGSAVFGMVDAESCAGCETAKIAEVARKLEAASVGSVMTARTIGRAELAKS